MTLAGAAPSKTMTGLTWEDQSYCRTWHSMQKQRRQLTFMKMSLQRRRNMPSRCAFAMTEPSDCRIALMNCETTINIVIWMLAKKTYRTAVFMHNPSRGRGFAEYGCEIVGTAAAAVGNPLPSG
eukprot:560817-Rhodomonas_salina.2